MRNILTRNYGTRKHFTQIKNYDKRKIDRNYK